MRHRELGAAGEKDDNVVSFLCFIKQSYKLIS